MTRWRIEGTLTVQKGSALHVGSGETSRERGVEQRSPGGEQGEAVEVSLVAVDHRRRPYIPGPSLKGALRRWARARSFSTADVDLAFGFASRRGATSDHDDLGGEQTMAEKEEVVSRRGAATFLDAFCRGGAALPGKAYEPPHWDRARLSGVGVGVAIDRRTRATDEGKLFHFEIVPPGIVFDVVVEVDDGGAGASIVKTVVAALDGFSCTTDPLTLGAGAGSGWGRLDWKQGAVLVQGEREVRAWLDALQAGHSRPPGWTPAVLPAADPGAGLPQPPPSILACDLGLTFDGPFLVNDPTRCGQKKDPPPKRPDRVPLRDDDGKAYLPAASFRGALRSQAERILRTVAGPEAACPTPAGGRCVARRAPNGKIEGLCPACILFGASGWRSPLQVTPFRQRARASEAVQDFLAIDSFTGGAARHLKFDAQGAQAPVLEGRVALDLRRVAAAGGGAWTLGLVALLVRDLVEGELSFGFGAAKGYGWCRASVARVSLPTREALPELFVSSVPAAYRCPETVPDFHRDEWRATLDACVRSLAALRRQEAAR